MPLEGDTVIKTCSDAMTPAVPPIVDTTDRVCCLLVLLETHVRVETMSYAMF